MDQGQMKKREVSGLSDWQLSIEQKAPNRNMKLRITKWFHGIRESTLVAIASFVIKFDQFSLHCYTRHSVPKYKYVFNFHSSSFFILKCDDTFFWTSILQWARRFESQNLKKWKQNLKIKVFGSDKKQWTAALLEEIEADQLPAYFGGTMVDPDGNPKCPSKVITSIIQ